MSVPHMNQYNGVPVTDEEAGAYSFHLVLFSDADEMFNLWLPQEPEGFFRFSDGTEHRFLSISAKDGQWIASCRKPAYFMEVPLADSVETTLSDAALLKISYEDRVYKLLVEKVTRQRSVFRNYNLRSELEISIGSQPDCEIYYQGPFISRRHAVIFRHNGQWSIKSHNEIYGIYVNGEKQSCCHLKLGDVVYIMGLKIIVGYNSLAMNNGLGNITIKPDILQDTTLSPSSYSHYYEQDDNSDAGDNLFNRAPRKRRESDTKVISVEGPPLSMLQKRMPLLLRMGSSMVMGGVAALAGNFVTLLTSVLFPFLNTKYSESERQEYEKLRLTKYTEYLQAKRKEILEAIAQERASLNQKYPIVSTITDKQSIMRHLWERRPSDSDFLHLRLGTGQRPMAATIEYPVRRFELEQDALEDKMYQMVETPYFVDNAPITLSLVDTYVCGIQGQRESVVEYVRHLVIQLALFHSYDEVKMVFLLDKSDLEKLDDVRYLPHAWDDQRSMRFIATNEAEAYAIGEYIKERLPDEEAEKKELKHLLRNRPYYVIFALNKKLFDSHEVLKRIMQTEHNLGVSLVSAHSALPKDSQKIITLKTPQQNVCTTMGVDGGADEVFAIDPLSERQIKQTMNTLANISLQQVSQVQSMPKMLTFLEMFKTGRIEQLNPMKRWRENNPTKSLAVPVGVGEDGTPFFLDLHEKRQGPHGLVAGMTGSGKSEFLITYILSMAVNFHPDEVAFVLIDYKGGGLASAFENPQTGVRLPHLVGTITNLDGASIQRSLLSIESELKRRQRVFNEVTSATNEGTMNIYTYQKLYRAGKVSEPMPHLFIVSDEFAELKRQQPEFMEDLISAARIGRSLGIHLILATQKPAGVVNDQIRSNTKFRVCLRVQERSDSMDMLKRPEAAELTDTGRFYLQVGYNEFFALGQSAWCGASYEPQDTVSTQRDDSIEFLDITGQVIAQVKPKPRKTDSGLKQNVAIVQYLDSLAKSHGIAPRQLWKPELPETLDLDELQREKPLKDAPMSVCLGLLDDPENQSQFPLVVDFETCGNLLIAGEAGSGKTTVIQNIIYLLSKQLSPEDFNFYGLDYSSRMMRQFRPLPHCGSILLEEDAGSLDEFFKLINGIISERKRIFSELEVDNFSEARKHSQIPLIVVFIDNFTGIGATKGGEAHVYQFQNYLKNSAAYGVKYIISCSHVHEVSSKVRQELSERICLHMRDKYDYSEMLGCKVSYYPPEVTGRGLFKLNERPHGLQNAQICAGADDGKRTSWVKTMVAEICSTCPKKVDVQHLAVVAEDAEYEDFAGQFSHGRIPLGYSKQTGKPVALPLKQFDILSLYFGNSNGTKPILTNLLHSAQKEAMELWIIKRKQNSLFSAERSDGIPVSELIKADYLNSETEDLRLLQQALLATMQQRKQQDSFEPILLLIESVADFCDGLSSVAVLSYCTLFEKLHRYGIHVMGCFEPGISDKDSNNALFSFFAQKDLILFGGQYDKQSLYSFSNVVGADKTQQFNLALMVYRQQLHSLIMPCGKIEQEESDTDLDSIF